MKVGDCFLCPGETTRTLYCLTKIEGKRCEAFSIYIDSRTLQALDYPSGYDLDLPEDIIMMPSSVYGAIKKLMREYADDIYEMLYSEALDIEFEVKAESVYTDGYHVYRMKELKDGRWNYHLFKIDYENISMDWSGKFSADIIHKHVRPITDATLQKVHLKFNELQIQIAQLLSQ
jgi:hypothetical protein